MLPAPPLLDVFELDDEALALAFVKSCLAEGESPDAVHPQGGDTALGLAISAGWRRVFDRLVEAGANPALGTGEWSPLWAACRAGWWDAVDWALAHGATWRGCLRLRPEGPSYADSTPLVESVLHCDCEGLEAMLQRGATEIVEIADDCGLTPLAAAAGEGHADAVRTLLRYCADPNRVGEAMAADAALDWAVMGHHAEIVRTLLNAGARSDLVTSMGHTAADRARREAGFKPGVNPTADELKHAAKRDPVATEILQLVLDAQRRR